jgi:hypothetical protein
MMTPFVVLFFVILSFLPQSIKAESLSIQNCLSRIQTHWSSNLGRELSGRSHHRTDCALKIELKKEKLHLLAAGHPIFFNSTLDQSSKILLCKVDREKLLLEFEIQNTRKFEKNEKVVMKLLKKLGRGLSLFLNQRPIQVLGPAQTDHLICHLD